MIKGDVSGAVISRGSRGMVLLLMFGIEHGLVFEHGAGEQAVWDGSQGSGVPVAAVAEGGVFGAACGIVLHGDVRPMIDGVAEPEVSGEAADDDLALAGAFGDRGDARQAPEGMVVSSLQGIEGLCEQRGEDDPADSWQGSEDRLVALLRPLPRRALPVVGEALGEAVELAMGFAELAVDEGEPPGLASPSSAKSRPAARSSAARTPPTLII